MIAKSDFAISFGCKTAFPRYGVHSLTSSYQTYCVPLSYLQFVHVCKATAAKLYLAEGSPPMSTYLTQGLKTYPDLNFILEKVFVGVTSVTIMYQSVNNLKAAEVFELNEKSKAIRVQCYYCQE